jgi:hypothetical protein
MIAVERQVELYWPHAVCCDSSGRMYVVNDDRRAYGLGGKAILVHSMEGNNLQAFLFPGLREDEWIGSITCHEQAGEDVTLVLVTVTSDRETRQHSLLRVSLGVFHHGLEP